ncbi:hypothetical protein F5Y12DRAFT_758083 [Xylaria sp. FL1777]|nr:hypothetical protein F5Y12DRAFT_758083 [Xylaria sp. FL1777]
MNGVVPACQVFDSIGVLGRAPGKIEMLLSALNVNNRSASPVEILYPTDWFPLQSEHQQKMTEEFLEHLEAFTLLKRTSVSIAEKWVQTAPEEFRGTSLKDFLGTVPNIVNGYDNLHNFDEFNEMYRLKFGKEPYVSPTHRERWDTRRNVTAQERDEGLVKMQKYREWAANVLFGGDSTKLMVVPQGRPGANYRDGVGNSSHPGTPSGPLGPIFTISMWGLPQVIIPIGQHPYNSRVSGLEEQAPMFTTLIGPAGADAGLLQLAVNCLKAAGNPTEVLPGRYMFAPPTAESANFNEQDDRNTEDGIIDKPRM